MKTPLRTSLMLLALLAVVDLGFQSCGHPSPQSGNGVGYETSVPPGGAIAVANFVYRGICADPDANEALLQLSGDGFTLTAWNCVVLNPAQIVDAREVTVTNRDELIYRGRTFTRETSP